MQGVEVWLMKHNIFKIIAKNISSVIHDNAQNHTDSE